MVNEEEVETVIWGERVLLLWESEGGVSSHEKKIQYLSLLGAAYDFFCVGGA